LLKNHIAFTFSLNIFYCIKNMSNIILYILREIKNSKTIHLKIRYCLLTIFDKKNETLFCNVEIVKLDLNCSWNMKMQEWQWWNCWKFYITTLYNVKFSAMRIKQWVKKNEYIYIFLFHLLKTLFVSFEKDLFKNKTVKRQLRELYHLHRSVTHTIAISCVCYLVILSLSFNQYTNEFMIGLNCIYLD
jgi:hypothetical protein